MQLTLPFDQPRPEEDGAFIVTRPLRNHRSCKSVLQRLHYVRRFFPELAGQPLRVGLTRAASGMAIAGGAELWLNPNRLTYHTVAHEMVHLLQGRHGVPGGERSCDVYSLARHWTLNDTSPHYVRVPRKLLDVWGNLEPTAARLVFEVAKRAIELRHTGTRNYIAYFEKTLKDISEGRAPAPSTVRAPELAGLYR